MPPWALWLLRNQGLVENINGEDRILKEEIEQSEDKMMVFNAIVGVYEAVEKGKAEVIFTDEDEGPKFKLKEGKKV